MRGRGEFIFYRSPLFDGFFGRGSGLSSPRLGRREEIFGDRQKNPCNLETLVVKYHPIPYRAQTNGRVPALQVGRADEGPRGTN